MDKPFSVELEEFSLGLVNLINNSSLPPQVISYCLQNAEREIQKIAERQLQIDRAKYKSWLDQQAIAAEEERDGNAGV